MASKQPLNSVVKDGDKYKLEKRSAGHTVHEWTSFSAFEPLFEELEELMEEADRPPPPQLPEDEDK